MFSPIPLTPLLRVPPSASCGPEAAASPHTDAPQPPVPVTLSRAQSLCSLLQPVLDGARRDICSLLPQLLRSLLPWLRERAIRPSRCSPFTPLNPLLITLHSFLWWRVCNLPVVAPPPPPLSTCHLMLGLLTGDSSSQTEPGTRTKPASTAAVQALN